MVETSNNNSAAPYEHTSLCAANFFSLVAAAEFRAAKENQIRSLGSNIAGTDDLIQDHGRESHPRT